MLFGKALTGALIAAAFASAQDDEPNGTHNTPNRVVEDRIPVTHVVKVGPNGHDFSPAELVANVSDIIAFHFFPKDHSVARAEYLTPCQPIEYTSPQKAPSFWSGFVIVDTPQADGPWFNVTVNDTEPIWYYCSQVKACSPDGMVGVVWVDGNPINQQQTFAAHQAAAKVAKVQLSPGDPIPAHGGTQEDDEKEAAASAGLSKEAIAGIAVGAVAGAAMLCVLVWLWTRNRDLASVLRYSRPPTSRLAPVPGSSQDAQPSPYMPPTPNYNEQKLNPMVQIQGAHSPDFNPHQSWMSGPTVRASSPDGYAQNGMMSPNAFANGFQQSPHNSYNPNLSPQPANYHLQSSPSETPWSPGGFGQVNNAGVPQEMGAGQHGMPQGNNGYNMSYRAAPVPVELDGQTSENVVGAPPPTYVGRALSYTEGGEAREAVQKPEDKSPSATRTP